MFRKFLHCRDYVVLAIYFLFAAPALTSWQDPLLEEEKFDEQSKMSPIEKRRIGRFLISQSSESTLQPLKEENAPASVVSTAAVNKVVQYRKEMEDYAKNQLRMKQCYRDIVDIENASVFKNTLQSQIRIITEICFNLNMSAQYILNIIQLKQEYSHSLTTLDKYTVDHLKLALQKNTLDIPLKAYIWPYLERKVVSLWQQQGTSGICEIGSGQISLTEKRLIKKTQAVINAYKKMKAKKSTSGHAEVLKKNLKARGFTPSPA